jgi:Avidin family
MRHERALQTASSTAAAIESPPDFSGLWKNQIGSSMDLKVNGPNVAGEYTSASSSSGGEIKGTLKGYISGDLISFLVLWNKSGSMTAWVGQMVDDQTKPKIKTLWHLVTNIPDSDEPTKLWLSVFTGADEFHR